MTGKAHRENANYSILLQQEPALKKDDITKLKQEFILIAKQYIPYQNRYDSCIEAIFAEFLSLLQPEKIATSLEDNIVLLTENISDFCKNKRANISHNAQLNALKNLPKQSKMLGTLLSREPACAPAKSEAPQETLIEKKKTVGQLIHWTPIVERVCLAMNIGDVILSGHHTKQERNFLAINPIVWYKEFAAHENISAEEAFSRIMKSNSVVATSKYRKASTKQKIKQHNNVTETKIY